MKPLDGPCAKSDTMAIELLDLKSNTACQRSKLVL